MGSYDPSPERLRGDIDRALRAYLAARRVETPEISELLEELERVVAAGGKRLRPMFCYWGYRAATGEDGDAIVRAAISFELLHTFALIHDDIMDSSTERRGHPTSFALLGLEQALLAGDLALVLADAALWEAGFQPGIVGRAYESYSVMQQQVIAGQYLDVAATDAMDVPAARRVARLKSGSYSVEGPLVVGAALAAAPEATTAALRRFGSAAGEAFQLRDDLLGLFGDPSVTGKSADADVIDGKRNFLYAATAERAGADDRARFVARWGAPGIDPDEIAWLRNLVESSGARAEAERLVHELHDAALTALGAASLPQDARAALADLLAAAIDRVA